MNIIPIICFGVLALAMAGVYTFFSQKSGWQGLLVRGLAVLSCIALAQISGSLRAITNAFPLFVTLGLRVLVLAEALKVGGIENEKARDVTFGALNGSAFLLISLGGLSLGEFNIFAVLGGVFLGVALGMLVCAIKKYKTLHRVIGEISAFTGMGFVLGFGLMALLSTTHVLSAIFMIAGGALLIASRLMLTLSKGGKVVTMIANAMYALALAIIALSIYLY